LPETDPSRFRRFFKNIFLVLKPFRPSIRYTVREAAQPDNNSFPVTSVRFLGMIFKRSTRSADHWSAKTGMILGGDFHE
jgi:hypothetical protein